MDNVRLNVVGPACIDQLGADVSHKCIRTATAFYPDNIWDGSGIRAIIQAAQEAARATGFPVILVIPPNANSCGRVNEACPSSPFRIQPADGLAAPSDTINESPTAPTTEPAKLPVVPKTAAEQEDIADIVARLEARTEGCWVSQDEFLDPDINANRTNFTLKTFRTWRETRYIVWSKKNPAIGMDNGGNFFTRKGKNPRNYRYRYFLLKEYDKKPPPHVPSEE